jgi:ABC-2 type transport system permease protein
MLMLSTLALIGHGMSPIPLWTTLPLVQMAFVMFYGLTVHVLWYAPIYGWLLLVSAWAKRATFLWAVLPFFAMFVLGSLTFGRSFVTSLIRYRFLGAMSEAFTVNPTNTPITRFTQLDPIGFLTSAGLWVGLMFAAAFIAAAIRLRRNREPI